MPGSPAGSKNTLLSNVPAQNSLADKNNHQTLTRLALLRPRGDNQREAVCLAIIELLWRVRTLQLIKCRFLRATRNPCEILSSWFNRKAKELNALRIILFSLLDVILLFSVEGRLRQHCVFLAPATALMESLLFSSLMASPRSCICSTVKKLKNLTFMLEKTSAM